MEEALFLTKFASKVTIVHRRDEFRASKIMAQRAIDHPKIGVLWNTTVDEVLGDDLVTGLKITNTQTGEQSILPVEGFFLAIGHDPNTNIFQDQLELDIAGYVVTEAGSTTTSVAGVFAAGDVVDHYYQQAVTAAGMGCQAAIDVEHWLDRIES
jgi:thioredoxin reductase (NADPH)